MLRLFEAEPELFYTVSSLVNFMQRLNSFVPSLAPLFLEQKAYFLEGIFEVTV